MVPVNYMAIVVAALASMVIGFIWYGPLFGKEWTRLMGFSKEDIEKAKAKGMQTSYGLMFLGSLVMAFVLTHALVFGNAYLHASGFLAGMTVGFWNWLGFIAPVTLGSVLWEGKPWKLWFLTNGYYLVTLMVMGVILALM